MYRIVKDPDYATSFRSVKKANQEAFRFNKHQASNPKSKLRANGIATPKGARVAVDDVSVFKRQLYKTHLGYLAIDPV